MLGMKGRTRIVWWHDTGNLILIQITSRMYHVEAVFAGVVWIIMKIVTTYVNYKEASSTYHYEGGLLGKESLKVQIFQI